MSSTTIAPSFDDLFALGQAKAQESRPDLAFRPGDVTVAQTDGAAIMSDANIRLAVKLFKATFLSLVGEDDVDALINDRYNLQRLPATAATVTLSFARLSSGIAGTIPAGTQVNSRRDAGGAQVSFTLNTSISVGAGLNGPFTVAATCQETGPDGNVKAGALAQIQGALFDTFTVTNPAGAGGGNLAESTDDYKNRARNFWATLRKGTVSAIEEGARQVPSVRNVDVIENGTSGIVTVVVSDADGNSSLQMASDVIVELENWRVAGPLLQVVGGRRIAVDISMGLVCRPGFDPLAVADNLVDAATTRINRGKANARLYMDAVEAAVIGQYPDDILSVRFLSIISDGVSIPTSVEYVAPSTLGVVLRAGTISVQAVAA